jgi:hypothetical protein
VFYKMANGLFCFLYFTGDANKNVYVTNDMPQKNLKHLATPEAE